MIAKDAISALYQMQGKYVFDLIFMDPPFGQGLEKEAIEMIANSSLIHPDSLIVMEISNETDISYLHDENSRFEIMKIKKYKTNSHVFLQVKRL